MLSAYFVPFSSVSLGIFVANQEPAMSVEKPPVSIKTEPEDETCDDVFHYDEALIKAERALLYAHHEIKEEMVIGPTEISRPPPGVDHSHWEAGRRAAAKQGVDKEVKFLQRLYGSRLVLRNAANELLCARCGQWSLTAAELHKHKRGAHSTEHPRDCRLPNASTTHLGNGFQAQPTASTDQKKNTSRPTTLTQKLFICDLCQQHFITKSLLAKHIHVHTKTVSSNKRDTSRKLKNKLPIKSLSWSCDICNKNYSSKSYLKMHKLIHNGTKAFACDKCGRSFTHRSSFSRHMLIHSGTKPFSCVVCGKKFCRKGNLSQHIVSHSGTKPFSCDKCGKNFAQKHGLSNHMVSHSGTKPFSCDECGKNFARKNDLSKHMVIHSGTKPFSCDKCVKNFARKHDLSKHMVIHSETKPFSCGKCAKNFKRKNGLSRHMFRHSGIKPHSCDRCGKNFARKKVFSRHLLIHG